jgi:aryl-alcohol dehydrogenase-like predicted oxidoreductase
MQYTLLGNTGLIVSRLCFGSMTFGVNAGIPALNKVDADLAETMVRKSMEAGINFFDTADVYANGQSESMLGKILAPLRGEVVIGTKVAFRTGSALTQSGLSRRHILSACAASLKRLNTDYIDLYIVHAEDPYTPLEETLGALDSLVREGKVRYLGFSNWSAWKAATALRIQRANGWAEFTSGQMHYSLLNREVEHDLIPFMEYAGLGMNVWSPLAGGFLSGKYTRENISDSENRHSAFDIVPFEREFGFKLVELIRPIAAEHGVAVADVAMGWLLSKPIVNSIIVGSSKLHQLEANLKSASIRLTPANIEALDRATAPKQIYPHSYHARVVDQQQHAALGSSSAVEH